jgi:hypothetical protein
LWVESLDGGTESGLELHRCLIRQNLVPAGFNGSNTMRTRSAGSVLGLVACAAIAVSTHPTCMPTTWTPSGVSSSRSELVADQSAALVAL